MNPPDINLAASGEMGSCFCCVDTQGDELRRALKREIVELTESNDLLQSKIRQLEKLVEDSSSLQKK